MRNDFQNLNIKIAMMQGGFRNQADFAQAVEMDESFVSRVLNGRRQLTQEQMEKWIQVLGCDPGLLRSVTKNKRS